MPAPFDQLKCKLTKAPILSYPNFTLPFILQTDVSDTAIGGILMMAMKLTSVIVQFVHFVAPHNPHPSPAIYDHLLY